MDAGFGGLQSLQPLSIDTCEEQITTEGAFKIILDGDYMKLQWKLHDGLTDMYMFRPDEAFPCDMLVANWWSCTRPDARWVSCLFAARIINGERHHVLNSEYVVRASSGVAVKRRLGGVEELLSIVTDVFGITLPQDLNYDNVDSFFKKGPNEAFHSQRYYTNTTSI